MNINLVLSPNPSYAGNWRLSAYESTNISAEVAFLIIPGPHSSPAAVTLPGLDRIPHLVKLVHVGSGLVLHDFMHQPMNTDITYFTPISFVIGDGGTYTPAAETTEYRNPYLKDKDYWVERRPLGTLVIPGEMVKVAVDPDYGFDLVKTDDVFGENETFTIHFHPSKSLTPANASVAGKWFEDTLTISANDAWDITHLKKLILLRGSGSSIQYDLPAAVDAPVGYIFGFQTFGSGWTSHVIASPAANIKDKTGTTVSSVSIGANQFFYLVYDGDFFEIVAASDLLPFTISDNPTENDPQKVASTVATKTLYDLIKVIASGKTNLGDVPSGDTTYAISFANPTSADYIVLGSLKSNSSDHGKDNSIAWAWWKDETTPLIKFKISTDEFGSIFTNNVEFCWLVVKI